MSVLFHTMRVSFGRIITVGVFWASMWLCGCGDSKPPLYATLTLKRDGSHFAGTVVRRDAKTVTITSPSGDTHTYLYDELADLEYPQPKSPANSSGVGSGSQPNLKLNSSPESSARAFTANENVIQIPAGTEFPVRTNGFLDSCCVPVGALSVGMIDSDVKIGGKVAIPQGANVTIELLDTKTADGRISMIFQLASTDFGNRHYQFSSAKGGLEPGAVVTFTGAKDGSPEAAQRGLNVHLDDQSYMGFKAASPVILKASQ